MASTRTTKNVQTPIQSGVFVGLRAQHFHALDMHAEQFHDDNGNDIFSQIQELLREVSELKERMTGLQEKIGSLKLSDLCDTDTTGVSDGDALIFSENVWKPVAITESTQDEDS